MRRWLSLELARLNGVAMNIEFPFPAEFVQRVFTAAFPGENTDHAFDRALLPWRILKLFPALLTEPDFAELARYLEGEVRPLKEYQLACKIASVFDRYLAYRPEMILKWTGAGGKDSRVRRHETGDRSQESAVTSQETEKNATPSEIYSDSCLLTPDSSSASPWQPRLWRELARGHETAHPPALARRLQNALRRGKADLSTLPPRVCVFGISSLPPFHIHLIGEVATQLEVHFFQLEPTDLFWGEIRSPREEARARARSERHSQHCHVERSETPLTISPRPATGKKPQIFHAVQNGSFVMRSSEPNPAETAAAIQLDLFTSAANSLPAPNQKPQPATDGLGEPLGTRHLAPGTFPDPAHSLLASMARVGRDFSKIILDLNPETETELFVPPSTEHRALSPPPTLLTQLQSNIFNLHERPQTQRTSASPADRSIQVHCCHSPMRELEILHDQLLARFDSDPTLTPRDILVTMPDVETYAPFIEAVFGAPETSAHQIPFSIADRAARSESTLADAFLRLLDLAGSRFGAPSVLALLDTLAIQRRFEIAPADLDLIRNWIQQSGIRWGIDAAHRESLGLPAFPDNTWRGGLRRLLLGYALPGDGDTLFDGILPIPDIEGALASTLGCFIDFAETLFEKLIPLLAPRPLADWERTLRELLAALFDENEESADEIRRIRNVLDSLGRIARETGFDTPVEFEVIRAHLTAALAETDSGAGFLAGRVTFCALKPMRSIPFKIICLLGMNDTAFPRRDPTLAFDLVAQNSRLGDRTLRDDDRQLFLETLLSAREALYISFCGLSPKDNSESPPSVLVSELLDYLEENFELPGGDLRKDLLVTKHRLQPFSPAYFTSPVAATSSSHKVAAASPPPVARPPLITHSPRGDDAAQTTRDETPPLRRLFSYSAENCGASISTRSPRTDAPPFITAPLPAPGPEWSEVDLDRFAEFFCAPAKFFLRERLGIRLPQESDPLSESEPLALDKLASTQLQSRLAKCGFATGDLDSVLPVLRATGALPAGYVGDASFREMREEIAPFLTELRAALTGDPLPPLTVDLTLGPDHWHLTGTIHCIHPHAHIRHRATSIKPADLLRAWISHLALNAAAPPGYPRETLLLGADATQHFLPVARAPELLADLLAHYIRGLSEPLPFFRKSSHEFARRTLRPSSRESPDKLAPARKIWSAGDFPESADPHLALCFRHIADPLDARWQHLALAIFQPLFEHT